MDKVILLKRHETNMVLKSKENGTWIKGKYIEKNTPSVTVRGTLLPVSKDTLKNFPQGIITLQDKEFFTKQKLSEGDILVKDNQEWKVLTNSDFEEIADINVYILKRSTKDD